MMERTLCERIAGVVLKIIRELLEIISIDVEHTLYLLTSSGKKTAEIEILLSAVNQVDSNYENFLNTA